MAATDTVGDGAVGLTMLRVVVTDVVCPLAPAEAVATVVTQAAVVVVLRGWVTVVVVMAAVVVVGGVTTQGAGGTVLMTELTLLGWVDITILD